LSPYILDVEFVVVGVLSNNQRNACSLRKELRDEVAKFVALLKEKSKVKSKLKVREFGYAKGKIELTKDFDEPIGEMKKSMKSFL